MKDYVEDLFSKSPESRHIAKIPAGQIEVIEGQEPGVSNDDIHIITNWDDEVLKGDLYR